jgi:DNA polymerase III epsilon subunit-like protein
MANATTNNANDGSKQLSKKEKGRHKKLLKRSRKVEIEKNVSGIASKADFLELLEHGGPMPGPLVSWRSGKERDDIEVTDHRDLLHHILFGISDPKKRKRDVVEPPRLPNWVCLHNAAAIDRVLVLELHCPCAKQLQELRTKVSTILGDRAVCESTTNWFGGNHSKSPSNTLMYRPQLRPQKQSNVAKTVQELHDKLLPLVLTKEESKAEGYPTCKEEEEEEEATVGSEANSSVLPSVLPSDITKEEATNRIKPYQVDSDMLLRDHTKGLALYVTDRAAPRKEKSWQVFAMDCEMVQTTVGSELARVTLVKVVSIHKEDVETEVVFDEVVRPRHEILDYLTAFSGMTADSFDTCVELEQVQASLLSLVSPNDIVIGHSLENDLRAARWIHSGNMIDTAVLFRREGARFKFSLRHLAGALLKIQIQQADKPHCSEEDAVTALQLATRRAIEGPSFAIWDKQQTSRLASLSQDDKVVCLGPASWLQSHVTRQPSPIHALTCVNLQDSNFKLQGSLVVFGSGG